MKTQIADITIDEGIQLHARQLDLFTVQNYAEAIESGAQFPPVTVFQDDGTLWLSDGLHRVEAHKSLGLAEIEADVREGGREAAMLHAAIANVANGKQMSAAEKREAGERLLRMTNWSDREIARQLAVHNSTVTKWRQSLSVEISTDTILTKTVTRDGVTYEMNVGNIGQQPRLDMGQDAAPAPAEKLQQEAGDDPHEPVADNTAVELVNIIEDARQNTPEKDTPLVEQKPDSQAQTLGRTLELTEERKEVLKSCQGWVVARLARTGVWRAHPDKFTSLKQFLKATGMKPGDVSTLTGFAEQVVPYCDEKGIEIDHLLTNEYWPKFRAGMAAIKAAIKKDDQDALREVLSDVERALTAESVSEKYRKPGTVMGRGAAMRMGKHVVYVLVLGMDEIDADDAADKVARRLGGQIEWSLRVITGPDGKVEITDEEGQTLKNLIDDD
jgi:ParB-like chromosome segregation protein Spo0J